MSEAETPAGVVRDFPLSPNRANLTLQTLADVYMACKEGSGALLFTLSVLRGL